MNQLNNHNVLIIFCVMQILMRQNISPAKLLVHCNYQLITKIELRCMQKLRTFVGIFPSHFNFISPYE